MKNNKGFIGIGLILAIIIGIAVIGGGAYYLGKSANTLPKVEENNLPQENQNVVTNTPAVNSNIPTQNNQVNNSANNSLVKTKTYINSNAGYQANYPTNWVVVNSDTTVSSSGDYNSFTIKNKKDATLPGSNSKLRINDSYIQINVNKNMDYSNYEEFIKDPKYMLGSNVIAERLANLKMVNIGGKTLQAFTGVNVPASTTRGRLYSFVYNKILYSITFASGSEGQFNTDKKIFDDLVSSFEFI